jgi:hypothetical protein
MCVYVYVYNECDFLIIFTTNSLKSGKKEKRDVCVCVCVCVCVYVYIYIDVLIMFTAHTMQVSYTCIQMFVHAYICDILIIFTAHTMQVRHIRLLEDDIWCSPKSVLSLRSIVKV